MRLRRWGVQPYVPDGPQYHFERTNRRFTRWGAKRDADALNALVTSKGYKIRYKVVSR